MIQAKCREFMARKKYLVKLSMIVIIQKYVRKWINHSTIQRRKNAIVVMQGFVESVKLRVKFKTIVRGMVRLQSKYRMVKEKTLRHYSVSRIKDSIDVYVKVIPEAVLIFTICCSVDSIISETQIRASLEKYVLQKDRCNPIILGAHTAVENHTSIFERKLTTQL